MYINDWITERFRTLLIPSKTHVKTLNTLIFYVTTTSKYKDTQK
jgi:hypothetical protein